MANTVNLGSVISPKPELTTVDSNTDITTNKDTKGRILVNSSPIITGYKYLAVELLDEIQTQAVNVYLQNTDIFVGSLTLSTADGSASKFFNVMIQTPFNYSISTDNVNQIRLIQNGEEWS